MRLLFALTLALCARADTINYTSILNGSVLPTSGNQFDYSGAFSIPQFDPSLGSLNSIGFKLTETGTTRTEVISLFVNQGYIDFSMTANTSFLGASAELNNPTVFGSGGLRCGIVGGNLIDATPCPTSGSSLSSHMVLLGTITDSSSSIKAGPLVGSTFVGALPIGLGGYIGSTLLSLPVSISVEATPYSYSGVLGGLIGQQSIRAQLDWAYDFTATPFVESAPNVTHAPEPGTVLVCAAMLVGLVWRRSLGGHHGR